MSKKIPVVLFAIFLSSPVYAYSVECYGFDQSNGSMVNGQCENGEFFGYENDGSMVNGSCSPGGMLNGFNSQTGAFVSGSCSSN